MPFGGRTDFGIDDVGGVYLECSLNIHWLPAEDGLTSGDGRAVGLGPNAADQRSLVVAGVDRVILEVAGEAHPVS